MCGGRGWPVNINRFSIKQSGPSCALPVALVAGELLALVLYQPSDSLGGAGVPCSREEAEASFRREARPSFVTLDCGVSPSQLLTLPLLDCLPDKPHLPLPED